MFIKEVLVPYLSRVYNNLIGRVAGGKDYLTIDRCSQYMALPALLNQRVIC